MEKNPTKNKYFTRLQEKISKTVHVHANYIRKARKTKINWTDRFPDRRRSRRLSNLPPVDEIKVEIKNEDISESFDDKSYSILTNNKIILNNEHFNYIKSEDYVDYKIKLEPTDNIDEFQDDDIGINEDILDESNLKSGKQNLFVEIKTKDNQNSFNSLENTNNIPETQFNVDEPTSFKSTINYDNINLNPDKKHEHRKILSSWNANKFDRDAYFKQTKTQETPKSYSINTETEKNASVHKTNSEKIKINQIESLQGKNSEAIKAENIPSLPDICSKVLEIGKMPNFSKNCSRFIEKEQISFLPETNSEIINTENMSSLPETTKLENILFHPEKNPISTDLNKIQTVSETSNKEKILSPSPPKVTEISDTEEDLIVPEYSGTIKSNKYFNMTLNEKVLYRRKLYFMTAIELVAKEEFEEIKIIKPIVKPGISKKSCSKVHSKVNKDYMERVNYRTNSVSDKVRRSYLLEYSSNNDKEGHKAVPILIPGKTSGTSFHPLRTCMHKCGNCYRKFESLDTPYHLAQIKNIEKQKACLGNSTPLIGPDSCLCTTCFRAIEKDSRRTYLPRDSCIIKSCKRTAGHICESSFIDKNKSSFNRKGITFRKWPNKIESMPFYDLHYKKVLNILDCDLCGNKMEEKFEIKKAEVEAFQSSLNYDQVPIVLNHKSLICKECRRMYLLWRGHKRICEYNKTVLSSSVLDLNSEKMELQINTEIEKKKLLLMSKSKPAEIYDNNFVMISSLRIIDNDKVFSDNYYDQNCSQTLQTEINTFTKSVANKSTTVIAENQQPNQQLVGLAVTKNNNSYNQIVPSIVGNQRVFIPVLQSVDRKTYQASAKKCLLKCQPNKCVQPLQPRSVHKVLNTVNTLPPPSAAIPFVRPLPIKCSSHSARVTGRVLKIFRSMQRHYPTPIRLIKHLLAVEKCCVLRNVLFSENKRLKAKNQKAYKLKTNALEGFRRGFSQNKFQSGATEGNIVKAVVKPLCNGIATIKNKDDNDCNGKIATIQKVNGLCKVVNNIGNVVKRHDFPSEKNVTSLSKTTYPIKIPNCEFDRNIICNLPPKVKNNKSSNGDSILSSNGVIIPPTYAAIAVTGTTTKPVKMSTNTTITIPSINSVCSNTNKRFIVLKKK